MRIDHLELTQFRGFESLALELDPSCTVLLGKNGAGKTAVLEGLAIAVGGLFAGMGIAGRHIRPDDARHVVYEHAGQLDLQPQWPVRVHAAGVIAGQRLLWERTLNGPGGRTTRAASLRAVADRILGAVRAGEPVELPVFAYYGTQRVWVQKKATEAKRGIGSRFDGYVDALDPASNHRLLSEWMYRQTLVELQEGKPVEAMRAVERAVCRCIEGATKFAFSVRTSELELVLEDDEVIPFHFLSDGYRNMVALAADIAWRAVVLNPHHAELAAEHAEGVVLIDEVDLHLHPSWQRRVLRDLRAAFPRIQFVVTTHSPQVIASAQRHEVRLLGAGGVAPVSPYVEGRDANGILRDVFGDEERPAWMQEELAALAAAIEHEKLEEAEARLQQVEARVGPDDPAVIRARWEVDRARVSPEADEG